MVNGFTEIKKTPKCENTLSDHDSIHRHRNLNCTERSVIARHQNFNAPKICKITVLKIHPSKNFWTFSNTFFRKAKHMHVRRADTARRIDVPTAVDIAWSNSVSVPHEYVGCYDFLAKLVLNVSIYSTRILNSCYEQAIISKAFFMQKRQMQAELLCVCICVVDLPKHPQMWIQKWKHCSFDRICFALSTKRDYNKQTCGYVWVSGHLSFPLHFVGSQINCQEQRLAPTYGYTTHLLEAVDKISAYSAFRRGRCLYDYSEGGD